MTGASCLKRCACGLSYFDWSQSIIKHYTNESCLAHTCMSSSGHRMTSCLKLKLATHGAATGVYSKTPNCNQLQTNILAKTNSVRYRFHAFSGFLVYKIEPYFTIFASTYRSSTYLLHCQAIQRYSVYTAAPVTCTVIYSVHLEYRYSQLRF